MYREYLFFFLILIGPPILLLIIDDFKTIDFFLLGMNIIVFGILIYIDRTE